jgi:hypothetical protein
MSEGCGRIQDGTEVGLSAASIFADPDTVSRSEPRSEDFDQVSESQPCYMCVAMKLAGLFDGECECEIFTGCAESLYISNATTQVTNNFIDGGCSIGLMFDYEVTVKKSADQLRYVETEVYVDETPIGDEVVYLEVPAGQTQGTGTLSLNLTNDAETDTSPTLKFKIRS